MNRGIAQLLDAIVEYLPSAAEVTETGTLNGEDESRSTPEPQRADRSPSPSRRWPIPTSAA